MSKFQRVFLLLGIATVICLGLVPPWTLTRQQGRRTLQEPTRYAFLFTAPISDRRHTVEVDFPLLIVEWIIVGAICGCAFVAFPSERSKVDTTQASKFARAELLKKDGSIAHGLQVMKAAFMPLAVLVAVWTWFAWAILNSMSDLFSCVLLVTMFLFLCQPLITWLVRAVAPVKGFVDLGSDDIFDMEERLEFVKSLQRIQADWQDQEVTEDGSDDRDEAAMSLSKREKSLRKRVKQRFSPELFRSVLEQEIGGAIRSYPGSRSYLSNDEQSEWTSLILGFKEAKKQGK